jgi:hypothetical protein
VQALAEQLTIDAPGTFTSATGNLPSSHGWTSRACGSTLQRAQVDPDERDGPSSRACRSTLQRAQAGHDGSDRSSSRSS